MKASLTQLLVHLDALPRAVQRLEVARRIGQAHAGWAEVCDDPVMAVSAQQALYADLLVLGQHDSSGTPSAGVPFDFAETVMAQCCDD